MDKTTGKVSTIPGQGCSVRSTACDPETQQTGPKETLLQRVYADSLQREVTCEGQSKGLNLGVGYR